MTARNTSSLGSHCEAGLSKLDKYFDRWVRWSGWTSTLGDSHLFMQVNTAVGLLESTGLSSAQAVTSAPGDRATVPQKKSAIGQLKRTRTISSGHTIQDESQPIKSVRACRYLRLVYADRLLTRGFSHLTGCGESGAQREECISHSFCTAICHILTSIWYSPSRRAVALVQNTK